MESGYYLSGGAVLICLLLSAFFSGAETALTGTMTISDQTFENVTFQGWLGD